MGGVDGTGDGVGVHSGAGEVDWGSDAAGEVASEAASELASEAASVACTGDGAKGDGEQSGLLFGTSRAASTAPTSEPASIGSPSAVPVPCASQHARLSAVEPARAWATRSSTFWAWPLGAVRLADRPSDRTALPGMRIVAAPSRTRPSVPIASPAAKPSAR